MDNSRKLVTLGTQDEDKHSKDTTEYVLDTTMRKQTQIRHTSPHTYNMQTTIPILL
jgi:hypothetical protein